MNQAHIDPQATSHNISCPNCQTLFHAYDAQIHNNDKSLVRCGLCLHIFNAIVAIYIAKESTADFLKTGLNTGKYKTSKKLYALFIGLIAGLFVLAATLFFRENIIQYLPLPNGAKVLHSICQVFGCTLVPVQYMEGIEILHSQISQKPVDTIKRQVNEKIQNYYLLNFVLQNNASFNVQLPNIELRLLDVSGNLLRKQILTPKNYLDLSKKILLKNGLLGKTSISIDFLFFSTISVNSYSLLTFYS